MIYEAYLNNDLFYYLNDEKYTVLNPVVDLTLNEAGTFECDIPSNNPHYADFAGINALRSAMITVKKDGEEIFCGEVKECHQNFDFSRHIYATGELAFLFDSIQPQARYQGTVEAMFTAMIAAHNSQVEDRKKFTVGQVLVTDPNDYVYHYTNREDTLTAIREKLCDTLDGYLRIRKVSGTRYIDLVPLENYGTYCGQTIDFGVNLLQYSANYTANDIATCVIPLGKRLEDSERTADAIEGLDEYLTIKGAGTDSMHHNSNDDFLYIDAAVQQFGWVRVVKNWDGVTTKQILKTKGEDWLTNAQYSKLELNITALDLSLLDSNIDSYDVGDTVHVTAAPFGMDTTFPVQEKIYHLDDFTQDNITLSNTKKTKSYTDKVNNIVDEIQEEIPQVSPVLTEAKARALALLLAETTGGHVVFEYHYNQAGEAEYMEAISICNASTIEASTTRWRWANGAFGYLKRNSTSVPWDLASIEIALTAAGEIVADMVKTGTLNAALVNVINLNADNIKSGSMSAGRVNFGTMQANRVSGGAFIVGGINNSEGLLASVESITWDASPYYLAQYDVVTFGVGITVYEAVWLRVTATDKEEGDLVGRYQIDNEGWQDLRVGDTLIGAFNTTTYIQVDALHHSLSFYKGLATVKTYIDNSGVVADNLVARNTGYIGDLVIDGREIFEVGDYVLGDKSYTGDVKKKVLTKFTPAKLYIPDTTFYVSVNYSIDYSPGNGYFFYLQYYQNGWQTAQYFNFDFVAGNHAFVFDNVPIQSTDTRKWRVYVNFSTLSVNSHFNATIYAGNIKILSFSDAGNYGSFIGNFTGAGHLDTSTSIGNIEFDNGRVYVDDDTTYIDASEKGYKSAESNSKYVEISDYPQIKAYASSDNYIDISADDVKMRLEASSNKYVIFRGSDDLYAKRSSSSTWSIAWTSSDKRNKEEIEDLDNELSRRLIDATKTKRFKYKDKEGKHYGMIAQDVRKLLDELGEAESHLEYCVNDEDEYNPRNINYMEYIPLLINYVKDLRAENAALRAEINEIKELLGERRSNG